MMMNNQQPNCDDHPNLQRLIEFALGLVQGDEFESISHHLLACSTCCAYISSTEEDDIFVEHIRSAAHKVPTDNLDKASRSAARMLAAQEYLSVDGRPEVPQQVCQYRILGEIGRGGMGVVYKAHDTNLQRPVALKMILNGPFATAESRIRFRYEAEMAARICHVHVIQVYEISEYKGLPFIVYEWVDGGNLLDRCQVQWPSRVQAAQWIEKIASAVHLAHSQGVMHRDLKPANILLAGDVPKIADFGLARRFDAKRELTLTGHVLGTPEYMSPEQCRGDACVGPATDIYSLGAILYFLLTRQTPFQVQDYFQLLHRIQVAEPRSIRSIDPDCPRDLAVITHKCLSKDPQDRYASADQLAGDLGRYLSGKPILARPTGTFAYAYRLVSHNPVVSSLTMLLVLALLVGVITSSSFALKARREAAKSKVDASAAQAAEARAELMARKAVMAEREALSRAYDAHALVVESCWERLDYARLVKHLEEIKPKSPSTLDLRDFEWYYWQRKLSSGYTSYNLDHCASCAAFDHSGQCIAAGSVSGFVELVDAKTWQGHWRINASTKQITSICFSDDDKLLAVGGYENAIIVIETQSGEVASRLLGHEGPVTRLCFSQHGLISSSQDGTLRRWDYEKGVETQRIADGPVGVADFDLAGNPALLAIALENGVVEVWDWPMRNKLQTWNFAPRHAHRLALNPSRGQLVVALAGIQSSLQCLDIQTAQSVWPPQEFARGINGLSINCRGDELAVAGDDYVCRRISMANGAILGSYLGNSAYVSAIAYEPIQGNAFLSAGADGYLRLWSPDSNPNPRVLLDGFVRPTQISMMGHDSVAYPHQSRGASVIDLKTGQLKASLSPDCSVVAVTSLGQHAAVVATRSGCLQVWDLIQNRLVAQTPELSAEIHRICVSPDGLVLAASCNDGSVRLWAPNQLQHSHKLLGHQGPVWGLAFSPDGEKLYSSGFDGSVRVWDVGTKTCLHEFPTGASRLHNLAISPTSPEIAVATEDGTAVLLDRTSGHIIRQLVNHSGPVRSLAYNADGTRLATCSWDRSVTLWDTSTGLDILHLTGCAYELMDVSVSPDGCYLVAITNDGALYVWNAQRELD